MATFVGNALSAHANGGCYVCARGDSLVDLGVTIVGEGALCLCKGCIAEAAEAAELTFNRAKIRELESETLRLSAELVLAGDRQRRFEAAFATLTEGPDEPEPEDDRCGADTLAGTPCKQTLRGGLCPSHGAKQKATR